MKKYLFLFILLFRIYPSICQHSFFIQGFVKDSASHAPLKDLEVVVINNEIYTKTNHQGYFIIPVSEKKLYNLMLFIPGYRSLHTQIQSSKNDTILLFMSPSIVTMDEVVITGTRFATNIKETPILTQIVSSQKIAISGSSQITTALSNTLPGLEFYNEGSGMTFQMQGIEAKYTLFLIDGERMAGENHDNIDYFRLGASNIEKIEIVKGASSTLYGSNA
ncbi:MAG TPA: TonB-dependent receptor plug domain-containing protein, partial [Bacteroidales bacterium]|nr:TonB-dependent receptor plug domain-containing protein [Bacteroidales bacterium]